MDQAVGRKIRLSRARRVICDVMHIARRVPVVVMGSTIRIPRAASLRRSFPRPPGWAVLFMKGFAVAAKSIPELRRSFIDGWRPHLYEHPNSVGVLAVARKYEEEDAVFFVRIRNPEQSTLAGLEETVLSYKEDPVNEVPLYRRMLWAASWPTWVRRIVWRLRFDYSGSLRANRTGTFSVSSAAHFGAETFFTPIPITSMLYFGIVESGGLVSVRLLFDHRVFDGVVAAKAFLELEKTMETVIADELEAAAQSCAA